MKEGGIEKLNIPKEDKKAEIISRATEELRKPENIEINANRIKKELVAKAEQLNIPIVGENTLDELLGDKPFLSHAMAERSENLLRILDAGEMQSSQISGNETMTYNSDKLIGMDKNVFLALGRGYMRKDKYALIFDKERIVNLPGVNFVEDDLMKITSEYVTNFLDQHKPEIIESIKEKRDYLKEKFKEKVRHAFQGGVGIYEKYFIDSSKDVVGEFLQAIEKKGFQGIRMEKEIIDQFTFLNDFILGEEVLPTKLREELIAMLDKEVVRKHTISGAKNIAQSIDRIWQNDRKSYSEYLSGEQTVPKKVAEIRIPNRLNINDGIVAIFVPELHNKKIANKLKESWDNRF